MHELIFHHYDFSNFSEKIRLVFGLKGLAWTSVEIPSTLPKPDYLPLTAGYRRTPALQIGADVYCDTHLIAEVLEAHAPEPGLHPGPDPERARALATCLAPWAEHRLLWPLARYVTGVHADRFPASFHADRARLHGKPVPEIARVKAAARATLAQLQAELPRLAALLPADTPFLLGASPALADLTLYHPPWLLETLGGPSEHIDALPRVRAWMERVAALGHGTCVPASAKDALAVAREREPQPVDAPATPLPEGIAAGEAVTLTPLDEDAPARGTLVAADTTRVVLQSEHPMTGTVHVHFPRAGYRLRRDRGA